MKIYIGLTNKRKTRATEAKRKGLEPFVDWLLLPKLDVDITTKAASFLNEEVNAVEEAIQGAQDIIAERIADQPSYRTKLLKDVYHQGQLVTTKRKKRKMKRNFSMYYDYSEPIKK